MDTQPNYPLVYVVGPRWGTPDFIETAAVATELWQMGIPAYAPSYCQELSGHLEFLFRSDFIVCLPGWTHSPECRTEVGFALDHHIQKIDWPTGKQELLDLTFGQRFTEVSIGESVGFAAGMN